MKFSYFIHGIFLFNLVLILQLTTNGFEIVLFSNWFIVKSYSSFPLIV